MGEDTALVMFACWAPNFRRWASSDKPLHKMGMSPEDAAANFARNHLDYGWYGPVLVEHPTTNQRWEVVLEVRLEADVYACKEVGRG